MAGRSIYVIKDYRPGKKRSRKPGFVRAEPVSVACVEVGRIRSWLGLPEDTPTWFVSKVLRQLRDEGALLPGHTGRLTRKVRIERGGLIYRPRVYVFRTSELGRVRSTVDALGDPLAGRLPESRDRDRSRGRHARVLRW